MYAFQLLPETISMDAAWIWVILNSLNASLSTIFSGFYVSTEKSGCFLSMTNLKHRSKTTIQVQLGKTTPNKAQLVRLLKPMRL